MLRRISQAFVLFWLGVLGLVFYAVRPVLFPEVPSSPELLPVYSLMMGLGHALRGKNNEQPPEEPTNDQ